MSGASASGQGASEHRDQDSPTDVGSHFHEAKRTLSATPELMLRIFPVIEMVYYLVNDPLPLKDEHLNRDMNKYIMQIPDH